MRVVDRVFSVDAGLTETWQTLIDMAGWPRWMPHLRGVEVYPPGKLDRSTSATIRARSGRPLSVVVTDFRPGRSFRLTGRVLGSVVSYDHVATSLGTGSEVLMILEVTGPTASLVGRWLGKSYNRQLDDAIPKFRALTAPA